MSDDINNHDLKDIGNIKFPVDKHLFEDFDDGIEFSIPQKTDKYYFKINGKTVKVLGDSKWEMIKRYFGRMND